ncbi:hypothetical protein GLOTRDRAFT_130803 [Gloeophyllum trabeum ATCC 11539]|uniref:Fatty acid desaturase domain-containing protein n=1 Tax=Gloeophyllum trabeum (strain ATCC 11539 / FP-39264 / Madison 617) TaxID=670483 RepID=S7Q151_GLOTA|nr:uncharacterized protein GLOTRDRAFT_130803 [Gloeophyllum trabeum ATCC 11539]EPQ53468.1 hypothetical protein GLOTRDRAFT_130803 [Gloeophyllum trabeum ATCC 11539]
MLSALNPFKNSREYEARLRKPFVPTSVTLKQVHDAVPKELLKPNEWLSMYYVLRDVALCSGFFFLASQIDPWAKTSYGGYVEPGWQTTTARWALWAAYWWFQGLTWGGIFCLGHDAGHGTLFNSKILNQTVGYILHVFLLIPYSAWRSTHHAHHKANVSMERDENYLPHLRSEYKLPEEKKAQPADYAEVFEETPIWTLTRMLIMQGMGWWLYLTRNTLGAKMYPPGTNHFSPWSPLFKPAQRPAIIVSDIGLVCMTTVLYLWTRQCGLSAFIKCYFIPYLMVNHWIVMFTYLHHSDPTIPHYRRGQWSFMRGASATVDRPLMGWMGRFFLHNISHDHVAHHFFIKAPFYNGPKITKLIRRVLQDDYNYDTTNTWYALYRSFTQCLFVEEEGEIIFYKNKYGKAAREVDEKVLQEISQGWNSKAQDALDEKEPMTDEVTGEPTDVETQ